LKQKIDDMGKKLLKTIMTDTVRVTIKLIGVFRINRFKEEVRTYSTGVSVREVVEELQLPGDLLGIVVINSIHASTADVLHDGDTLTLFPLLDGG
jgi:molybdopterin converting factor small subunit